MIKTTNNFTIKIKIEGGKLDALILWRINRILKMLDQTAPEAGELIHSNGAYWKNFQLEPKLIVSVFLYFTEAQSCSIEIDNQASFQSLYLKKSLLDTQSFFKHVDSSEDQALEMLSSFAFNLESQNCACNVDEDEYSSGTPEDAGYVIKNHYDEVVWSNAVCYSCVARMFVEKELDKKTC